MKKIAIFGVNAQYKVGGTEVCINQIYNLFKDDYDIEIISGTRMSYDKFKKYKYKKLILIKLLNVKYLNYFSYFVNYFIIYKFFKVNDFDLVIANCSNSIAAINATVDKKNKAIYFVHDEFSLNKRPEYDLPKGLKAKFLRITRRSLDYPFFIFHCIKNSKALKSSDKVLSNSSFLANLISNQEGITPNIIYPFTQTKGREITNHLSSKYITMVGSGEVKGIKTFLAVAALMPQEEFRVVGRSLEKKQIGNVLFHPFYDDVTTMYADTKLLLVPSIWQEAFGKVSIEASSHSIPVIVSKRGGLPETVCDKELIVNDYLDPLAWKSRVEIVMGNAIEWGEKCQKHSLKFDQSNDAQELKKLLTDLEIV
ncbi:glycosyltransferase [Pseudoalteromonas sp. 3-MNA-CIBAN-0064]|uniref:glycosyltransferase n=1 Tax=Pseudoalteromonas sp. 3-MNA-CIBAN-0064 TaxID=3140420 RepID=UPI0033199E98|tara:strand:- start:11223 stop:12323 length:1101 start_codon:yes stop_codon:yes gene_type:complete